MVDVEDKITEDDDFSIKPKDHIYSVTMGEQKKGFEDKRNSSDSVHASVSTNHPLQASHSTSTYLKSKDQSRDTQKKGLMQ